jgi:hypothetical protein
MSYPARAAKDHVVQFYSAEPELAASVASYLAEAVRAGGTALIVATAAHRDAFGAALARRGVDLGAARRTGALVERDARHTLDSFRNPDGSLEPARFEQVIGALIRAGQRHGGPVRAYGEMVALLWEMGQIESALKLEVLWNRLGAQLEFSLYCGYPARAATVDDDLTRRIADLHSAVHDQHVPAALRGGPNPAAVIRFFDPDARHAAAARGLVHDVLSGWNDQELVHDAALLVTELAANALRHTAGGFWVELAQTPSAVRITVGDASPDLPEPRHPPPTLPTGRGLVLINALAHRWGITQGDRGKAVWTELARTTATHP